MATSNYVGPLNFVVFVVPAGAELTSVIDELQNVQAARGIEVLDLELLVRDDTGTVRRERFGIAAADGVETDLLDDEDLAEIGGELAQDERALVVVYEDRSLAGIADGVVDLGGREVWAGGIDAADLDEGVPS